MDDKSKLKKLDALLRIRRVQKSNAAHRYHVSLSEVAELQHEVNSVESTIKECFEMHRNYIDEGPFIDPVILEANLAYANFLQSRHDKALNNFHQKKGVLSDARKKLLRSHAKERVSQEMYNNVHSNYLSDIAQRALSDSK